MLELAVAVGVNKDHAPDPILPNNPDAGVYRLFCLAWKAVLDAVDPHHTEVPPGSCNFTRHSGAINIGCRSPRARGERRRGRRVDLVIT